MALDLSQESPRIVELARWFAGLLKVELRAVHVVVDPVVRMDRALPFDREQVLAGAQARAAEEKSQLLTPETARDILVGPVTESLSRVSLERGPSLLVLGSHGLGRVNRWLLGSTTEEILSRLPTSLAIVPSEPDWV